MKDGWWINYESGRVMEITEHERDIRDAATAKYLGVPASVSDRFKKYEIGTDRCRFLVDLMKRVRLMRVRGYGNYVTFNYWSPGGDAKPFAAIRRWASRNAGPVLLLNVANLATGRQEQVFAAAWPDFVKKQATAPQKCSEKGLKTGCKTRRNFCTFGETRTVRKNGRRADRIREAT